MSKFSPVAILTLALVVLAPWPVWAQDPDRSSAAATGNFDLHPELEIGLFAAEPMMANPTNIDVDHLGRVWVCEVLNYRHFANRDATPREEGDRILILEDTNGDAVADKTTVFYQGRDIDSAHGICVLGDRAIVSANDSVFWLIDTDGDLKADVKKIMFTGISGTQHDHGIHAFVFGPDGKLYFNFGNAGKQIKDAQGNPIVDLAGNEVNDKRKPYNQGMIFRCNLDGSQFETLAWNFRNNWEMCIDSFGTIWQSDNDDDGNKATRINYVMPFGNYGYTNRITGSGWRTQRTGMHDEIPLRHWHLNDPGVVPNLLQTGAGSPTGICIYEGSSLPKVFHNEMIHCDAGPSIVRSYPVEPAGAGYTAKIVNMVDGAEKDKWFRPSDVCVAPDGSLIVADWYDPGVGGHRMQDTERGRLFRVTAKGSEKKYSSPAYDFTTPESAAQALRSPNHAARYLAWKALEKFNADSVPALVKMWGDANPRMKARALWLLGNLDLPKDQKLKYIHEGFANDDPNIRITALRLCVHLRDQLQPGDISGKINPSDPSPGFRRELLIALRQWPVDHLPMLWAMLADQYDGQDRWYLEALGIAADGHTSTGNKWDECLKAWMRDDPSKMFTPAGRQIIWRSQAPNSLELIAKLIEHEDTEIAEATRLFRATDFLDGESKGDLLAALAFGDKGFGKEKSEFVFAEAASRIKTKDLSDKQIAVLNKMVESSRGTAKFVSLVGKFSLQAKYPELLKIASAGIDRQMAADAMGVLMEKKWMGEVHRAVVQSDIEVREKLCDALVNCRKRPACWILGGVAKRPELDAELRTYCIQRLGEIKEGAGDMVWWIDQKEKLDPTIMPAIGAALHRSKWDHIKKRANELFPIAAAKDNKPLPQMSELVSKRGDAIKGKIVFDNAGTCSKCHKVGGQGVEVGPDLSEIGDKLSRIAMYESILFPSAGISHNYENWMVLTEEGQTITGLLMGESGTEVLIKDDKGINHTIPIAEIDEKKKLQLSLMPADLHQELTEQDLVDLVEYLMTLKK